MRRPVPAAAALALDSSRMKIVIDLDLEGLERVLGRLLPLGGKVRPTGIRLDMQRLRLRGQAPLLGEVVLVAKVTPSPGRLLLSGFDLEGAGLARGMALSALKRRIGEMDERWNGLRVWGEPEGDRLHLEWPLGQP